MKEPVIIKVQPNGLILMLDGEIDFLELVKKTEEKIAVNSKFYGSAKMTIAFEGRNLTDLEEQKLIDVIMKNSMLEIICILDKSEQHNEVNARILQKYSVPDYSKYARMQTKSISENQIIEHDGNLIVLGDVPKTSSVIVTGNVFVLGTIFGEVYAGTDCIDVNYVIALDFQAERLEINKIKYKYDKKDKKHKKSKEKAMIAYADGIKISIKPFTNELPFVLN